MIVTSFEYEKWQQEYANRASGTTQQAGSANEQNSSSSGQAFAAQLAVQQLEVIKERMYALSQLMQDLVEQASERAAEKEAQQALLSGAAIDSKDTQRPFGV